MESAMRAILISLLVLGVCGCGSDDAGTPEQPVSTPTPEQPVDDPTLAAKTPDNATDVPKFVSMSPQLIRAYEAAAKIPDAASLKMPLPVAKPVGDPIENSIGMVLVSIPAGEFMMGSRASSEKLAKRFKGKELLIPRFLADFPRHRVTLTKSFHLGRTEVTQGQWKAVMGTTPWKGKIGVEEGDDYPATHVSWDDAVEFCRKLSEKEGVEYRLPTEAEWEYACRAGTTTVYSFGDDESQLDEYAWSYENAWIVGETYAHIVGQKKPNPWGLHDMHGNVWEWVQDRYGEYPSGDVTDPSGPPMGWNDTYRGGHSSIRHAIIHGNRGLKLGFRVLRSSAK